MNERIGYPEFILEPDQLDSKYEGVSTTVFWRLHNRRMVSCPWRCILLVWHGGISIMDSLAISFQLQFDVGTYFENILRVEKHDSEHNLHKIRQPVLKDE